MPDGPDFPAENSQPTRRSQPECTDRPLSDPRHSLNDAGRYELGEEIARGAMGAIVRSKDLLLNRELAVKVLIDGDRFKADSVQRFFEEAQINGQLQHPGIVPVYELGVLPDQRPFFSMKLVKGQTLKTLLAQREGPPADLTRFLGIFEQVCQTLAYAHSRRVIHRDLKPANIMVGAFGEVQVMDWGIAKTLDAEPKFDESDSSHSTLETKIRTIRNSGGGSSEFQTCDGVVFGTLAYMSPEQALGETGRVDERSDVFGLGAILCEILTGSPPYQGDTTQKLFRSAAQCNLDEVWGRLNECDADAELVELAKSCLSPGLENRPADAGAVANRMSSYFESVDRRLREAELSQAKTVEQKKRNRVMMALGTVVMLSVASLAVLWGWVQEQRSKADKASLRAANSEIARQQELASVTEEARQAATKAELQQSKLRQRAEVARTQTEATLCDVYTVRGMDASLQNDTGAAMMWFAAAAELVPASSHRRKNNLLRAKNWAQAAAIPVGAVCVDGRPYSLEFQPRGDLVIVRYTPLTYGFRDAKPPTELFKGSTQPELAWLREQQFRETYRVKHDNKFVVFDWQNNQIVPWTLGEDAATGRVGIPCWSADGKLLAIAAACELESGVEPDVDQNAPWRVKVFQVSDGKLIHQIDGLSEVTAIKFNHAGNLLAVASDQVQVFDIGQQIPVSRYSWDRTGEVYGVDFAPDDRHLVAAALDNVASIYFLGQDDFESSGELVMRIPHVDLCLKHLIHAKHTPPWVEKPGSGYQIIGITDYESLAVWDVDSGQFVERFDVAHSTIGKMRSLGNGLVAIAANQGVEIRRADDLTNIGHSIATNDIAAGCRSGGDGNSLLVGKFDTTAQLYSVPELKPIGPIMFHDNVVGAVDIADGNRWLATSTMNGLIRIWTYPSVSELKSIHEFANTRKPEISSDGKVMLASKSESYLHTRLSQQSAEFVDLSWSEPSTIDIEIDGRVKDSCWSDALKKIVVASEKNGAGKLTVFSAEAEWSSGREINTDAGIDLELAGDPYWVEPHPLLPLVAVVYEDGLLNVVDLEQRKILLDDNLNAHTSWRAFLKFTPDGKKLIACTADYFEVYDLPNGKSLFGEIQYPNANSENCNIAISPDSKVLAISSKNSVVIWDLVKGKFVGKPLVHTQTSHYLGAVASLQFSPNSKFLLTGALDCHARLWDWRTGIQVCPPMKHDSVVRCAAFIGQGGYAVTGNDGKRCGPHFWDLRTGMKIAPSLKNSQGWNSVVTLSTAPDGKTLYGCAGLDGEYCTFSCRYDHIFEPGNIAVEEFQVLGRLTSSKKITLGQTDRMPKQAWLKLWNENAAGNQRTAKPDRHELIRRIVR